MDESVPGGFAHLAWIEGGPDNILPANGTAAGKQYVDNARAFTLENRHLEEGQTYTLCVSRRFTIPTSTVPATRAKASRTAFRSRCPTLTASRPRSEECW